MLIFYPVTLPKVFIRFKSFLGASSGSFKYWIISSINRANLTSSFSIYIPFLSFSYLIALAKDSSTTLSKSGESRHPCFSLHFRGNTFSFPSFSIMLIKDIAFIMLRSDSYISSFFKAFIMKGG
jgi:hypothetical protein